MDVGEGLQDILSFEIPHAASAGRLARRLQAHWTVSVSAQDTLAVAFVRLNCDLELAQLLRVVETWVIEESFGAIRFHVDGRSYILEAGEANWMAAFGIAA
jgi:hypothetical protein